MEMREEEEKKFLYLNDHDIMMTETVLVYMKTIIMFCRKKKGEGIHFSEVVFRFRT